jgi:cytochrome c-type protein NapB
MNKLLAASLLSLAALGARAEELKSLRGHAITDAADEAMNKPTLAIPGGFAVAWEEQPPMIPHPIENYSIDLRQNGCLKCHSPATFEAAKAPRYTDTHRIDRDGKQLDRLAPRRYFCTQCHAPQAGAMPLVENVFGER